MNNKHHAMQFPCEFPIKVMGLNTETFQSTIKDIIRKHVNSDEIAYSSQPSRGDKYISITATFTAQSKEQLNALYQELNDHELVLMTL
jgi:putative lipoic acid-binding regulatory protein